MDCLARDCDQGTLKGLVDTEAGYMYSWSSTQAGNTCVPHSQTTTEVFSLGPGPEHSEVPFVLPPITRKESRASVPSMQAGDRLHDTIEPVEYR